jgi:hypothetical protein
VGFTVKAAPGVCLSPLSDPGRGPFVPPAGFTAVWVYRASRVLRAQGQAVIRTAAQLTNVTHSLAFWCGEPTQFAGEFAASNAQYLLRTSSGFRGAQTICSCCT